MRQPAAAPTPDGRTSRQGPSEFLALMAAASATIAIAIDAMLPALGDVRTAFGLDPTSSETALIITVFVAGTGVGQIVYGPLSDRFGRRPVFWSGLGAYVVAGLVTSLAPNLGLLLVGRFFWGLAAAGPRVVTQAMLRDRFDGDGLSRALSLVLAVFLIVPATAPAVGQAVLALGSWRYTFAIGPVFGALVGLWSLRLEETLDPANRRPVRPAAILAGIREVLSNRAVVANIVALLALSAAFLPYLASSERMYGEIYGRGDQFFLWFGAVAVLMAGATLATSRLVGVFGTERLLTVYFGALVTVAVAMTVVTVTADGVPPFGFFVAGMAGTAALNTALTPLVNARALLQVGHVAGTAASVIGAISFVGGAVLSPIIDGAITDTITPYFVGYAICGTVAAVASRLARQVGGDET